MRSDVSLTQMRYRVLQHALELVHKMASNIRAEVEIQILKCIGDAHYALGQVIEAAQAYQSEADRAAEGGLTKEQVSALTRLAYTSSPIDSRLESPPASAPWR